jgi:hypothetical protein
VLPWGDRAPVVYVGSAQYRTLQASFAIISDGAATSRASADALRAMNRDATLGCYRDDRGRKLFGVITLRERDEDIDWYQFQLTVTETNYSEAVDDEAAH